jgi:hypothetical protein
MAELVVATTLFQIIVINTKLRQNQMQQQRLPIETRALILLNLFYQMLQPWG